MEKHFARHCEPVAIDFLHFMGSIPVARTRCRTPKFSKLVVCVELVSDPFEKRSRGFNFVQIIGSFPDFWTLRFERRFRSEDSLGHENQVNVFVCHSCPLGCAGRVT